MSLSASCLLAQANLTAVASPSVPKVYHVGVGNYFKIGTPENPVIANEYCSFLNSEKSAAKNSFFYDGTFMNSCNATTLVWDHISIKKDDCITRYNKNHFHYSVIPGRGNYIIDGLESWPFDSDWNPFTTLGLVDKSWMTAGRKEQFENWRKNPSAQDACAYLNAKIEGHDEDAKKIEDEYSQNLTETFNFLNVMAVAARNNQELCLPFKINDEQDRCLIVFSMESGSIFSPLGLIQAVVVPGMEYYRPSRVELSTD